MDRGRELQRFTEDPAIIQAKPLAQPPVDLYDKLEDSEEEEEDDTMFDQQEEEAMLARTVSTTEQTLLEQKFVFWVTIIEMSGGRRQPGVADS